MEHINTPIFQALFHTQTPKIILKGDVPDFTILDYNTEFQLVTGTTEDHRGQSLFNVYNSSVPGTEAPAILTEGLHQAIHSKASVKLPAFRYDIHNEITGEAERRWWQAEVLYVPKEGDPYGYLILTTNDVTGNIASLAREQQLTEDLAASYEEIAAANEELNATLEELSEAHQRLHQMNEELEQKIDLRMKQLAERESSLRSLVMSAHYPLMILRGREWVIEIANQPLVNLWDKSIQQVTGHKLMDILPEIEDQPFPGFLRQVYDSGVGYGQEEQIFHYNSPSGPAVKYVSFYYDPMRDDSGEVCGIIVAADDITAKVLQREQLQQALVNEQAMLEQMNAVNDELLATVEELTASNEELEQSRHELVEKNNRLSESEHRFRHLIRQAPVGICVIRANDMVVTEVNDGYLELVGKTREETENQSIWDAVAEAAESYRPIMDQVISTATPFIAKEHELELVRRGIPEKVFIDFVYEPVLVDGLVSSIMVVGIEVTDKVRSRKAIEDIEERIRLAVEAAEIGTFEHNYFSNKMLTSPKFDAIFGVERPASRLDLLSVFHPDDVHLSKQAHLQARESGQMFYETRLLHNDGSLRWIRIQGKVFFADNGSPEKLLGTILDITDFKRLEQQKDDFISIASHELKTPITSLKASLQLLQRQKDKGNTEILPRLIDQAGRSMEKISALIEDLLNVSRMNAGTLELNKKVISIGSLLDECYHHVKESETHQIVLQGDLEVEVFVDADRIDQVLTNLVTNAVKYAPASPLITIRVTHQENEVRISVVDQGPGIPEDKLPHLFDRYFRVDESGKQVSGLGLGLYISSDIVERHGGKIGVESKLGEGSTFWFTLPVS